MLTEEYAKELWQKYVGSKKLESFNKESLIQIFEHSQVRIEWVEKWNQGEGEEIATFLFSHVKWPIETKVLYFWSEREGIETTWKVFLKYWMNFLFNDEWPILVSPTQSERVVFSPDGSLAIAK